MLAELLLAREKGGEKKRKKEKKERFNAALYLENDHPHDRFLSSSPNQRS